jgi:hypothetical protein
MNAHAMAALANTIIQILGMPELTFEQAGFRTKFNYALVKNRKMLVTNFETLNEAQKADPKWVEYESKRVALCEKHCDKDKDGKPVMVGNMYSGLDERSIMNKPDVVKEFGDLSIEYKDHLHDEVDISKDIYKIEQAWLPVSPNWTGVLYAAIEELCN